MRKVILNLAVSLDGFIEGPNGEYDWCFTDQDYGLEKFVETVDTIFMGRKSYELISGSGDIAHLLRNKIFVFSDTLTEAAFGNIEMISSANLVADVNAIREQDGNNIWLFGGASLVSSFLANALVDEILLSVHPVLLGGGKQLFQAVSERTSLNLVETTPYSSGLVQLRYQVLPKVDLSGIAGFEDF